MSPSDGVSATAPLSKSDTIMKKHAVSVYLLALAIFPVLASAQGRDGGRGQRGQRDARDSATTRGPRVQLSLADVVYAHRGELQLSDSQTTRVSDIRMVSMSRAVSLNRQLDSLRSAMVVTPEDVATPPTDSSRKATMAERRALASVLGQLHDVDLDARNQTLALLSADQQKKAQQLEISANAAPTDRGSRGGGESSDGGRRGGGMGGGHRVPLV